MSLFTLSLFFNILSNVEQCFETPCRGKTFQPVKGKHVLKRAESHRYEVNTIGILACKFSTFSKVSQRDSFSKIVYRI